MKRRQAILFVLLGCFFFAAAYGAFVIRRGLSAADQPSALEAVVSRSVRNLGIPGSAKSEINPWTATPDTLRQAGEVFADRCASCHGKDANSRSEFGQNLYPKAPDLRAASTQS